MKITADITADTITDEQIRALRDDDEWNSIEEFNSRAQTCNVALARWRHAEGREAIRIARARCAEILNARAKEP